MRRLIQAVSALAIVLVVVVAVAYLLPREVAVSRSAEISAPPETVYGLVSSLQETEKWSPWMGRDPEMTLTYTGPEQGVGNKMSWTSDDPSVGNGTQEITAAVENERVETALDFGDMGTANAYFALTEKAGATEITWGFTTDLGMNPVSRYMGLMFDSWIGADYEAGLEKLKQVAEAG